MTIKEYIDNINHSYQSGNATEHTYRGDLQMLIKALLPQAQVTNEPKRIACGAPDYIIFTDYLTFHHYNKGECVASVSIGKAEGNNIKPMKENVDAFEMLIKHFYQYEGYTIKTSQQLAQLMADKSRFLAHTIYQVLCEDMEQTSSTELTSDFYAFKQMLIKDIKPDQFANLYAQTIAYGLFAARLNDDSPDAFSRQEAIELIPESNPFIRKFFGRLAGFNIDKRIQWLVDSIVAIFQHVDLPLLMSTNPNTAEDPIMHFYETYLAAFDPKVRKSRGVWYTPKPVVKFIVRAVDDILKGEFGLTKGLASDEKISTPQGDTYKVQILDPATGTGAFLTEVVERITKAFSGQEGVWRSYVRQSLLPRIHGFEILMASYAMAHLSVAQKIRQSGADIPEDQRLSIYLTNSLEEPPNGKEKLPMIYYLAQEADAANKVKNHTPVMVVLGNPPYSGESANKGEWIMKLMEDYKKEPQGKGKLKERNPKMINDDYVKFMRYGQHFIEKNGSGILAFINAHGFLDNLTFRGMRWHLLKTYDNIYILDLHGNSKKKETAPDGSKDVNVFDIQQGVSINLLVKTGKKKADELGKVYHCDLYGERQDKYDYLSKNDIKSIDFQELPNVAPNYFFVPKNFEAQKKYSKGFKINELFPLNSVGVVTSKDKVLIAENTNTLKKQIVDFYNIEPKDELIKKVSYRPLDSQLIYYDIKLVGRARTKVMQHFLKGENVGLVAARQCASDWRYVFITKNINDINLTGVAGRYGNGNCFPLYLYPEDKQGSEINFGSANSSDEARKPNLYMPIVERFADRLALTFTPEKEQTAQTFAPIDMFDYIYAVLHSPRYRETYKEFLKIDFPRVPYPDNAHSFWQLVKLGGELRQLHLLESETVNTPMTSYRIEGSNEVETISYQAEKVFINDKQYFDGVPRVAWEFYIGGYQPVQKWLKDRKDRVLNYEDILHYQKVIVALIETHRLMNEVDAAMPY